jgi:hypothetical protein
MTERQTLFDPILIGRMHRAGAPQVAAALGIFGLHQVALAGARAQHLPARRYFETFGGGFFGFDAFWTTHKTISFLQKERVI